MMDIMELLRLIDQRAQDGGIELPPGATEAQIADAERALGMQLPEDVKAFYRHHNGGPPDEYICEERELLSLERMVGEWRIWKDLLDGGDFGKNDHGSPDPGVQQKWWIPEWIPITYDGCGNHHVIDIAPAEGGTPGQILSFWHDDSPRTVVGRSLLSWLAETATWGDPDDDM